MQIFRQPRPHPHHLHQNDEFAARVGQKGKPEAYYFPPQYNFKGNIFPYTFMGLNPGVTRADVKRCLERWNEGDNEILDLSRAYRLKPGTGWQIEPAFCTLPARSSRMNRRSIQTFSPCTNRWWKAAPCRWDLLVKDVPPEHHNDLEYILDMLDWPANTDPEFAEHRSSNPAPVALQTQ